MKALTVLAGLAMLGVATALAPAWARPAAVLGVGAVALTLPVRTRSPAAVTAAAVAVLLTAAGGRGGPAILGEGLLVLGQLLLAEAIGERRPFRFTVRALAAGVAGSGTVALALLLPAAPRTALVLTGMGAIAAAYALAVPLRSRTAGEATTVGSALRRRRTKQT